MTRSKFISVTREYLSRHPRVFVTFVQGKSLGSGRFYGLLVYLHNIMPRCVYHPNLRIQDSEKNIKRKYQRRDRSHMNLTPCIINRIEMMKAARKGNNTLFRTSSRTRMSWLRYSAKNPLLYFDINTC